MLKKLIKTILYCIFIIINLIQCSSERSTSLLFLYSKDKKKVVTVITDLSKHERIIANGKHFQTPSTDFYKLDISNISELGDEIGVCWKEKGWEIVNDKAKITEVKIDTTNYIFRNRWFTDDDGIPRWRERHARAKIKNPPLLPQKWFFLSVKNYFTSMKNSVGILKNSVGALKNLGNPAKELEDSLKNLGASLIYLVSPLIHLVGSVK